MISRRTQNARGWPASRSPALPRLELGAVRLCEGLLVHALAVDAAQRARLDLEPREADLP
jgi:hypothetical protein